MVRNRVMHSFDIVSKKALYIHCQKQQVVNCNSREKQKRAYLYRKVGYFTTIRKLEGACPGKSQPGTWLTQPLVNSAPIPNYQNSNQNLVYKTNEQQKNKNIFHFS